MTVTGPQQHVPLDDLLDYFESRLSEGREQGVEEHLAVCADCTRMARQVYAGEAVLEGWTAAAHGQAHLRAAFARALDTAASQPDATWRDRLERWRRHWSGAAEAAARIVLESSTVAGRVLAGGLDALSRPGSGWHFTLELQPAPVRGAGDAAANAAVLTASSSRGGPRVRLAVSGGDEGVVVIRVDDVPPGTPLPLVLLIASTGAPPTVRVAQVERPPHASYAVARFEDLPPGEYVVAFEPLDDVANDR